MAGTIGDSVGLGLGEWGSVCACDGAAFMLAADVVFREVVVVVMVVVVVVVVVAAVVVVVCGGTDGFVFAVVDEGVFFVDKLDGFGMLLVPKPIILSLLESI